MSALAAEYIDCHCSLGSHEEMVEADPRSVGVDVGLTGMSVGGQVCPCSRSGQEGLADDSVG